MFVKGGPNRRDGALLLTALFAAAGVDSTPPCLDIGQAQNNNPRFELEVNVPALPALVDHSVTFRVQDSADGVNFADLGISFTVAGVAGTGPAAIDKRLGLPSTCREYVAVVANELAGGANLTALSYAFQPVFWGM